MKAGQLRQRGVLQQATDGKDSSGGPIVTWSDFLDPCWARVVPLRGREWFQARQVHASVSHRVEMRYVAGVRAKMRFLAPRESTTLNGAIDNAVTELVVSSAAGLPTSGSFRIRIEEELLEVTAGQGTTTWTVTRGADGTTPASHADGKTLELMVVHEIEVVMNIEERDRELHVLTTERV